VERYLRRVCSVTVLRVRERKKEWHHAALITVGFSKRSHGATDAVLLHVAREVGRLIAWLQQQQQQQQQCRAADCGAQKSCDVIGCRRRGAVVTSSRRPAP